MSVWARMIAVVGKGRRVPSKGYAQLTSKRGNITFYKGKGCAPTGRHTSKGGYIIMENKLPNYIVPDLTGFKLKPYVSRIAENIEKQTTK